jgi:large subunit ribosomal protein L6
MSRIGRMLIAIPSGVTVTIGESEIQVKGPKGSLTGPLPGTITAKVEDGALSFGRTEETKPARALHGLTRALAHNMIVGVTTGFERGLEIEGVGYRADVQGDKVVLTLGFSHPVDMKVPDGLSVKMNGNTSMTIQGIDKEAVGQFAANIRRLRPPEPYKGKGIRYSDERIRRKVGKTGA